jgi:hypothetical protein
MESLCGTKHVLLYNIYIYNQKINFNVSDVFDSLCSPQYVSAAITYVILTGIGIIFNCYSDGNIANYILPKYSCNNITLKITAIAAKM